MILQLANEERWQEVTSSRFRREEYVKDLSLPYVRHGLEALLTHFVIDNESPFLNSVKCFNLVFIK